MMQVKNGQEGNPADQGHKRPYNDQQQVYGTPPNRGGYQLGVGGQAGGNLVGIMPVSSSQGNIAQGGAHHGNPNGEQEINKIKLKIKQQ